MFLTQEKKTFDTKYINKSATNHGEVSSNQIEFQNQPWSKLLYIACPKYEKLIFLLIFKLPRFFLSPL